MSELEKLGITAEASASDDPAMVADTDAMVLVLASGAEVPITDLQELRPGLWAYMAGPTAAGSWLVGQIEDTNDLGIN